MKKYKKSKHHIQKEINKFKDDENESLQVSKPYNQNFEEEIYIYKRIILIMGLIIANLALFIIIILFRNHSKREEYINRKRLNENDYNYINESNIDNEDFVKKNISQEENINKAYNQNEDKDINEGQSIQINDINKNSIDKIKKTDTDNDNNDIDFKAYNDQSSDVPFDFSKLNYSEPLVKRKIYVKYTDFWPAFVLERFDVHKILIQRYDVVVSENPDYVIFSEFGGENYGIENRFNCVKLFLSIENRGPSFENTDYAIGIHYINKGDRYFRKPTEVHQLTAIHSVYNVTKVKGIDIKKKKFCAWVVSNGGGLERNAFYDRLSKYKIVDSGGSFRNNVGGPVDDKLKFLQNYKFSICFENSKTDGYISEKLSDAFEAGTIPIYFGDDTVLEILNNRSYIHVKDESEFDEKIELIKKIDQNDTLYEEMIREKIVIDDSRYPREVQKYKNFIYHIIEQDKEKAKRFERHK